MATADMPVDREVTAKGNSCRRGIDITSSCLDFEQDIEFLLSASMNPMRAEAGPSQAISAGQGWAGQGSSGEVATSCHLCLWEAATTIGDSWCSARLHLISSSSWFIGLVVMVPRCILFSQEVMCMYLVRSNTILLPLSRAAGWCSCSAQTEHPCVRDAHSQQRRGTCGWWCRDGHGAGMLMDSSTGMLVVQACSDLPYGEAHSTGIFAASGVGM